MQWIRILLVICFADRSIDLERSRSSSRDANPKRMLKFAREGDREFLASVLGRWGANLRLERSFGAGMSFSNEFLLVFTTLHLCKSPKSAAMVWTEPVVLFSICAFPDYKCDAYRKMVSFECEFVFLKYEQLPTSLKICTHHALLYYTQVDQ